MTSESIKESRRICNFAVLTQDFGDFVETGSLEPVLLVPIIDMASKDSGLKLCSIPFAYCTPSEVASLIERGDLETADPVICERQREVYSCPEGIDQKPSKDVIPLRTAIAQSLENRE